jgi:glycine/serine hydroxymethyltransferase
MSWNREVSEQSSRRHKTLRGPRAGLIFFRKDGEARKDLEKRVNDAVFPACQGGPHNNTIAGIATTLLQATQPSWKAYAQQVIKNAQALADELVNYGYKLQTGGTDTHLVLWDLRPLKLTGSKIEKIGDLVGITINSTFHAPSSLCSLFADNVSQRMLCRATRPHKCQAVSGLVPPP